MIQALFLVLFMRKTDVGPKRAPSRMGTIDIEQILSHSQARIPHSLKLPGSRVCTTYRHIVLVLELWMRGINR